MNPEKRKTVRFQDEKENLKADGGRKIPTAVSKSSRNPLTTLSDNIPQKPQKSTATSSKEVVVTKKVKYDSDSEPKEYYSKSEIVTESATTSGSNEANEVVVTDEKYINYLTDNKHVKYYQRRTTAQRRNSEVAQTVTTDQGAQTKQDAARIPARKVTLVRKLSRRNSHPGIRDLYINCMYDPEYFEDNYRYMLKVEAPFVVDKHRLQKCSNYHYRLLIVNWLIYAHKVLELSETTLFAAVRMFDHMLVATQIPDKKYQLVGITCMWIASKLYDHYLILVPKLFSLCSGKFSKYQIISTEKEILKVSSFNVNFPDPSTFLFYFLKEVGLENDPKIRFSAMFVMEMFTFVLEYTSSSPSLLAASALFIALCQNGRDYLPFLKYVHSCLTDVVIFKNYTKLMWFSIKQVLKTTVTSNEIVAKYSVQDKLNVAQLFSPL